MRIISTIKAIFRTISSILDWFDESLLGMMVGSVIFFGLAVLIVMLIWCATGPGIDEPSLPPQVELHQ